MGESTGNQVERVKLSHSGTLASKLHCFFSANLRILLFQLICTSLLLLSLRRILTNFLRKIVKLSFIRIIQRENFRE